MQRTEYDLLYLKVKKNICNTSNWCARVWNYVPFILTLDFNENHDFDLKYWASFDTIYNNLVEN